MRMLRACSLQRWRLGRVIVLLVLTVVLLQLVHMMLLTRLEAREGAARLQGPPGTGPGGLGGGPGGPAGIGGKGPGAEASSFGRQLQGRSVKNVIAEMHERVKNSYRLDKSGTYHVIDNFLTSEHVVLEPARDVTLVTQCSSGKLQHLVEMSERWRGPVSVAVFTYDDDFAHTVDSILYHHFCSDSVFKFVTFHLVFPISRSPKDLGAAAKAAEGRLSCSQPPQKQTSSRSSSSSSSSPPPPSVNYAISGIEFPHNVLRNLAINYVQTRYVLVVDVDMLTSEDLRVHFQKLLSRLELDKDTANSSSSSALSAVTTTAFVVPVFEVKDGSPVPGTKQQLLRAWGVQGTVRPFYSQLCAKCQRPTEFDRWRAVGLEGSGSGSKSGSGPGGSSPGLGVAYTVDWRDPWEPFYISTASLPLYDERFKQYGFNRISQVCEMHVAGYTFAVLDNAFVVHKGFKTKAGFHASKDEEQHRNRLLFRKFKEELKTKYPTSTRRC